jgi:phosphatidylglycerol:prolipoprotein diacylglycerol transferase
VFGVLLGYLEARRRRLEATYVLDAALAAAVGGLIVARATYVGLHWNYYTNHLGEALRLRDGGLAWQGALLGGTAGAALVCGIQRRRLAHTLDVLATGAASVAIFAWMGCFMAGCAYGVPTYPGQGLLWSLSLDLPDLYGIREPRVALQLLGAGWSTLVLGVTLAAQRRTQRSGLVFASWLTLDSLGSFVLGFLRADNMPLLAGWRVDQVANLALAAGGVGMMLLVKTAAGVEPSTNDLGPRAETGRQ